MLSVRAGPAVGAAMDGKGGTGACGAEDEGFGSVPNDGTAVTGAHYTAMWHAIEFGTCEIEFDRVF